MAIEVSKRAQQLSRQININPSIIVEIEGIDIIFGTSPVLERLTWDTDGVTWDQEGVRWDSLIEAANSRSLIELGDTTKNITQQILPDKGGSSSISSVNISFVNKNNEVSKLLSFDNITEILGRKSDFYIGFKQGIHPEDSIPIFRGVITDFWTVGGRVVFTVSHPDSLKRQVLFQKYASELTAAIDSSQTNIPVVTSDNIILPQDNLKTYLRIDDELMEVTAVPNDTSFTVIRGSLNSTANPHDDEATTESMYVLNDSPINMALKVMLSNDDNAPFNSLDVPISINYISPILNIPNAILFDYFDIQERTGLVSGDKIFLDSVLNTGTYTFLFSKKLNDRSYIVVSETLVTESEYIGTFSYNSQYNVLPNGAGLGMLPNQVDVQGHRDILSFNPSNFVDYSLKIKDSIDDVKTWIDTEVYFPQGLYSIPRKARSSVKLVNPPLSTDIVPTIDENNITNILSIKKRRSVHKNLYNTFTFYFNQSSLEDKFLAIKRTLSLDSINRINIKNKELAINSNGLKNEPATLSMIDRLTQRFIDRYRFAPVYYDNVEVLFRDGYRLEVGDTMPFGGEGSKLTNFSDGTTNSPKELFECVNKSLDITTGKISLSLLQTGFEINGRYAVFSIASQVGIDSTASRIVVDVLVNSEEFPTERTKWERYIGQRIRVRSEDYTVDEVTFFELDNQNENRIILDPPLTFTPLPGYIIEPPDYDNSSSLVDVDYKLDFAHMCVQETIVTSIDNISFEVSDASRLLAGSEIYVHSKDYVRDSFDTKIKIDNILGNTVTLESALAFVPLVGDLVENSRFLDGGDPYLLS